MMLERTALRSRRLAALAALPILVLAGPAAAQYCDNLEGKDVRMSGRIDRAVEAAGVVFFRDRNTSCQFGIVLRAQDRGCRVGATIEVVGKLVKNKFMPDTYDVDRGSRPTDETLVCK
jgi:hypothetical protein